LAFNFNKINTTVWVGNMASRAVICNFVCRKYEGQKFKTFKSKNFCWKAVADYQSICMVIARFQVQCPVGAFLLLLLPWARNFTPIASATQLLNQEHIVYCVAIRVQLKSSCKADVVIPVKEISKKIKFIWVLV